MWRAMPRLGLKRPFAVLPAVTLLVGACGGNGTDATAATAPTLVTPPAELTVSRGQSACFTRQERAVNFPAVRGYRLAAPEPLPPGLTPSVRAVRFVGSGPARVLEAEICFRADPTAPVGRAVARLELRLYDADAERLAANGRLRPVRTLAFSQAVQVQ
jgi:hypothetical protein